MSRKVGAFQRQELHQGKSYQARLHRSIWDSHVWFHGGEPPKGGRGCDDFRLCGECHKEKWKKNNHTWGAWCMYLLRGTLRTFQLPPQPQRPSRNLGPPNLGVFLGTGIWREFARHLQAQPDLWLRLGFEILDQEKRRCWLRDSSCVNGIECRRTIGKLHQRR